MLNTTLEIRGSGSVGGEGSVLQFDGSGMSITRAPLLLVFAGASLKLTNVTIRGASTLQQDQQGLTQSAAARTGSAVKVDGGQAMLQGVTFEDCATTDGGVYALRLVGNATATMRDCVLEASNTVSDASCHLWGDVTICSFADGRHAGWMEGSLYAEGGSEITLEKVAVGSTGHTTLTSIKGA